MADVDVKALMLQVDASVELLRRNLNTGESQMARFEQRGTQMADRIDQQIAKMGQQFGPFAEMAQSAAQRMQQSFEASFDDIQRRAADALKQPLTAAGGLNLGSEQLRAAAEQARNHALAVGLIEDAARRAAIAQGDTTEATRLYIQAASAARIESEREARSLLEQAGAMERLEIETAQAARAQGLLGLSARSSTVSAGQLRAGTQQLGFQMQDLGVQVAMAAGSGDVLKGTMMALTMQGPQVVSAISLMRGEAGGLIGFLGGPWGAAFMAAVSVAAILGTTLLGTADAEKEAEKAAKDHEQAVKRLREQLRDAVQSAEDRARATYMEAEADRVAEIATRNRTQALLEQAKVRLQTAEKLPGDGSGEGGLDIAGQVAATQAAEVKRLEGQLAQNKQSVKDAELAANRARGLYQGEILSAVMDPIERVRRRFQQQERALIEAGGDPNKVARELRALREARDAEVKSIQAQQKATKDAAQQRRDGADATPAQVSKMLLGKFGGTITSTTGGKHVDGSYHYRGQAVDFVPPGGMGSISKEQIRSLLEGAGLTIKELLGPGDKGHNDHFHVAWSGGRFDSRQGSSGSLSDAEKLTQQYQAQSDQLAQQLKIQQMRQQGLDYEADLEEARFTLMRQFPGLDAERLNRLFEMSKALIDQKAIYDDILGVVGRVRDEELKRTQTTTDADWAAIAKAVNDDERLVVRDPFANATAGAKELARTINQDIAYGLKGMMRGFDDLGDVALNILYSIGDALIDNLLNKAGSGGGSSGGIGGAIAQGIGSLLGGGGGFAGGGYTGDGPATDPAGVVHKGEYVFDAATTRAIGRENLAAMAQGRFRLPSVSMAAMGNRSTSIRMGDTQIVLNAQGAGPREVDALRAEVETLKQEVGPRAVEAVRDYQERTFGRGLR